MDIFNRQDELDEVSNIKHQRTTYGESYDVVTNEHKTKSCVFMNVYKRYCLLLVVGVCVTLTRSG